MKKLIFSIIGAGNGGHAFAVHLTLLGFKVNLYDVDPERVQELKITGKIRAEGALKGEVSINLITNKINEAIVNTDIIMVVIPSVYHASIAKAMAPYVSGDQIIVLNPGATGGALEVMNILKEEECSSIPVVAETNTLLYACRSPRSGEVLISGLKEKVCVAALPSRKATQVANLLNQAFPQFQPVSSIMMTSLENVNAMLHPAPTILNAGRIESQEVFRYYFDGVTPSIAALIEQMDNERLEVGKALGANLPSVSDWYGYSYGVQGESLYDKIQGVTAYEGIQGSTSLNNRYLFEDIPTGLVPLSELGKAVGIETPTINAIVELGNTLLKRNFWEEGRSLKRLGLEGKSSTQILELLSS
ncbi:NAD/NADP-dependent octopine/nopaline dehydrogenase family protein [Fictibacillus fluitans]|uniref:NAD/NADP octopine/nopaline dehydrogenase family protein n=1 Tax=Fictibacillus fluitans TaxID=3058422 RepID=A0ABT8HRI6_9BACL|nr:NAD/NADP-dependent octopine/nopaline dehydrogenase family protein [Fictibacillus sp. NE201]MDN4523359.1 NAD/NADP octopine/nopaline dehydrogenase family protein [Fictibacillus sp. NE201]